jgi:hypothetical protein
MRKVEGTALIVAMAFIAAGAAFALYVSSYQESGTASVSGKETVGGQPAGPKNEQALPGQKE